jgi:uncharacterized phage protein (TIGR01671 family)
MFNNRIIKFRAWDRISKKMRHTFVINVNEGLLTFPQFDGNFGSYSGQGDYELIQFTGLYDSTEKEIYENDILDINQNNCPNLYFVTYRSERFLLSKEIPKDKIEYSYKENNKCFYTISLSAYSKNAKIVGNIFENSDLLSSDDMAKPGETA